MDLDIEMGEGFDASHEERFVDQPQEDILGNAEADEPGEIADEEPMVDEATKIVPTKLHIRGVDSLHTNDIRDYVKAHFGRPCDRVEWIDDTSANLLFSAESSAQEALVALSTVEIADVTALSTTDTLPAKPIENKPEISLQVRFATESDKKEAGAATRSRYYLLHPEHDPEERRRRNQDNRSRYRERDGNYRRDRGRRRSEERSEPFDASMYDDAPRAERRRSDDDDDRRRSSSRGNRGKELFSSRRDAGRGRSASPGRGRDDGDLFDARAKASRNRNTARDIKKHISAKNDNKELFSSKMSGQRGRLDELEDAIGSAHLRDEDRPRMAATPDLITGKASNFNIRGAATQKSGGEGGFSIKGAADAKELFPTKLGGDNAGKELLGGNRRARQRAEDLFG